MPNHVDIITHFCVGASDGDEKLLRHYRCPTGYKGTQWSPSTVTTWLSDNMSQETDVIASNMDLSDWAEVTFNDKEISLTEIIELLKDDPSRFMLHRSKQYPSSSLVSLTLFALGNFN